MQDSATELDVGWVLHGLGWVGLGWVTVYRSVVVHFPEITRKDSVMRRVHWSSGKMHIHSPEYPILFKFWQCFTFLFCMVYFILNIYDENV